MVQLQTLLVGAAFRPPAKLIIENLPVGTRLELEPEPENPYDEFAVRVLVDLESIPASRREGFDAQAINFATSFGDLLAESSKKHVGYLASADGKPFRQAQADGLTIASGKEIVEAIVQAENKFVASLAFGPAGQPMVTVRIGEGEANAAS